MIRFDQVSKAYSGTKRPALDSINLEVVRGEFVFLVGPSGSGKSTCLRLILKEEKPSSGKVQVLGQDLGRISNRKIPYFRRNIGVVFQDFRLLNDKTVFDNVAFTLQVIGKSAGFIHEAVPDVLKMVGLEGKAQRMPNELSGGEQQRVAIARAVVNKPQVLLADEPTGNLDPATSAGIMALLERISAGGTTVLMATHEAGIVNQMQKRVVELSGGMIIRDENEGMYGGISPLSPQDAAEQLASAQDEEDFAERRTVKESLPHSAETPNARRRSPEPTGSPAPTQSTGAMGSGPTGPMTATGSMAATPIFESLPPPHPREQKAEGNTAASSPVTGKTGETRESRAAKEAHETGETEETGETGADSSDTTLPESLSLAEKLGLRARGEKHDPTSQQDVGPTK